MSKGKVQHWHTDAKGMASSMGNCAKCRGFLIAATPHDNNVPISTNKKDQAAFARFSHSINSQLPSRATLRLVK